MKILLLIITLGLSWTPSYEHIVTHTKTSKNLVYYLSNFDYKNDGYEKSWKTPQEFIVAGGGNCVGFGILVYEVLQSNGYMCNIYGLNTPGRVGHIVVTYKKGDDKGFFSTYWRVTGDYTIDEIMTMYKYSTYTRYNWRIRRKYLQKDITCQ